MILHIYLARRFVLFFVLVLASFFILSGLADFLEQVGRYRSMNLGMAGIFELTLYSTPISVYKILPLIMIISALILFLNLARSSELVVIRAGGRSVLTALTGPLVASFVIGCIAISVWNPLNAALQSKQDRYLEQLAGRTPDAVSLTGTGLWLRQADVDGQTVINAKRSNADGTRLLLATFWTFDGDNQPKQRISAQAAILQEGHWQLLNAKFWTFEFANNPESNSVEKAAAQIPSSLTQQQIQDGFGDPSGLPIWDLPQFIQRLEQAGFAASRHRVWLYSELSLPLFLSALVLMSAVFSTRITRAQSTAPIVIGTFLFGFALFFVRNFAKILGENDQLTPAFAAWAPPMIGIALALSLILHREDG